MPHPYHVVHGEDGRRTLTIFLAEHGPVVVNGDHPHYDELILLAEKPGPASQHDIVELADLSVAVAAKFDRLSERVSVADGRVFFDGDEIEDTLTRHLVRCLDDPGVGEWYPLVRFLENVSANPNEHSREQLYDWLDALDFSITEDGRIVGYKGVHKDDEGGWVSGFAGSAIVDGEAVNGRIPNAVGSTVEMPRARVQHDPSASCSTGLHVGTYEYAKGYANGALLKVLVNPRDVVSVPTDAGGGKVRVCRYEVAAVIDAPETRAVVYDDEDYCESCGEPLDGLCEWCD